MVPNKRVHSGKLPLEHDRAYARLFGNSEYLLTFNIHILSEPNLDLETYGVVFPTLIELLRPLADTLEEMVLFGIHPNETFAISYQEQCSEFINMINKPSGALNQPFQIIVFYGLNTLDLLTDESVNCQIGAQRNKEKVEYALQLKRASLETKRNLFSSFRQNIRNSANLIGQHEIRLNDEQRKIDQLRYSLRRPPVLGLLLYLFSPASALSVLSKLKKIEEAEKAWAPFKNHFEQLIQIEETNIEKNRKSMAETEAKIRQLEDDVLEVDEMKNVYSKSIDDFKSIEEVLKNIKENGEKLATLIEECNEDVEDCDKLIPIHTRIEELDNEGKTFSDILALYQIV